MSNSFAERLREAMDMRKMTLTELADRSGVNKSSISEYLAGKYEAKQSSIFLLAQALRVSPAALMGIGELEINDNTRSIPVLSNINSGKKDIDRHEVIDTDKNITFAIQVNDNGMIGARIAKGDVVYVDADATINNGDIVVATRGEEDAVIRYYHRYGPRVILMPANPDEKESVNSTREVKLHGKVVYVLITIE